MTQDPGAHRDGPGWGGSWYHRPDDDEDDDDDDADDDDDNDVPLFQP